LETFGSCCIIRIPAGGRRGELQARAAVRLQRATGTMGCSQLERCFWVSNEKGE
jgi:hypothetical protein